MSKKNNKQNYQKISLILVFSLFLLGGIILVSKYFWPFLYSTDHFQTNNNKNYYQDQNNKIYSVKEVADILKNNPEFLQNKQIKIKAYQVDGTRGIGCDDYLILIDYDNVELYKKRYQQNVSNLEKLKALQIPKIKTGESLGMSQEIFPAVYAVYQGHFYDKKLSSKCKNGYKRFVIDKKIKEIIPDKNFANLSETIQSGCLIANGRLINNPIKVELKNNTIKVNGILYEPTTEARVGKITMLTNDYILKRYRDLINYLKNNKIIIYGGDSYEGSGGYCEEYKLFEINKIIKSHYSSEEKKEKLAKILGSPASFNAYDDMLKNWTFNEKDFYHCPKSNEMYQGNHLDCQPPFNTKKYCQKGYRKWINDNCEEIIFVD